jgi:hypothetical protein
MARAATYDTWMVGSLADFRERNPPRPDLSPCRLILGESTDPEGNRPYEAPSGTSKSDPDSAVVAMVYRSGDDVARAQMEVLGPGKDLMIFRHMPGEILKTRVSSVFDGKQWAPMARSSHDKVTGVVMFRIPSKCNSFLLRLPNSHTKHTFMEDLDDYELNSVWYCDSMAEIMWREGEGTSDLATLPWAYSKFMATGNGIISFQLPETVKAGDSYILQVSKYQAKKKTVPSHYTAHDIEKVLYKCGHHGINEWPKGAWRKAPLKERLPMKELIESHPPGPVRDGIEDVLEMFRGLNVNNASSSSHMDNSSKRPAEEPEIPVDFDTMMLAIDEEDDDEEHFLETTKRIRIHQYCPEEGIDTSMDMNDDLCNESIASVPIEQPLLEDEELMESLRALEDDCILSDDVDYAEYAEVAVVTEDAEYAEVAVVTEDAVDTEGLSEEFYELIDSAVDNYVSSSPDISQNDSAYESPTKSGKEVSEEQKAQNQRDYIQYCFLRDEYLRLFPDRTVPGIDVKTTIFTQCCFEKTNVRSRFCHICKMQFGAEGSNHSRHVSKVHPVLYNVIVCNKMESEASKSKGDLKYTMKFEAVDNLPTVLASFTHVIF